MSMSSMQESLLLDVAGDDEYHSVMMADPQTGLTSEEANQRLKEFGINVITEPPKHPVQRLFAYFTGPMPIMIWIALIVEILDKQWPDVVVLLILQFVNGVVGFVEEQNASDAIESLRASLSIRCTVRRDGRFKDMDAKFLVPGDVISLKLGDVVPADCVLLDGPPLEVDQGAMTGESLPILVYPGENVKMGASVKRGEILANVVATGTTTFFGKARALVDRTNQQGRFQVVLFKVSTILLAISTISVIVILCSLLARDTPALRAIAICVVVLVASIPIAMQVVATSTMAVGARRLAQDGIIVSKLSAIEEMAGMTVLCCDKTGTLTMNQLRISEPVPIASVTPNDVLFIGALACKRTGTHANAIDDCILSSIRSSAAGQALDKFEELDFVPFDPISKRTQATIRGPDGKVFKCMKGAPQVVLPMCEFNAELEQKVSIAVQELADRGLRCLGVARTDEEHRWVFVGLVSIFDPPRPEIAQTIYRTRMLGIDVKMVTGDQIAIARDTCRRLGMGTHILGPELLDRHYQIPTHYLGASTALIESVVNVNGFAEVYPEHKLELVQILAEGGHVTGVTGDGVNDAPALKKANIGIAVANATQAARAAADIVLTHAGLSEIVNAVVHARKIFARVRNYCIYRIAATFQLVVFLFVVVLSVTVNEYFPEKQRRVGSQDTLLDHTDGSAVERVFVLPVFAVVLLALLNDGPIITIAKDAVKPADRPQQWNIPELFAVSAGLGMVLVVENIFMFFMGLNAGPGGTAGEHCGQSVADFGEDADTSKCATFIAKVLGDSEYGTMSYRELKSLVFLTMAISAFLTVFSARTTGPFYERLPGGFLAVTSVLVFLTVSLFASFADELGTNLYMEGLQSKTVAFVWAYVLVWFLIQDLLVKQLIYRGLSYLHKDEEYAVQQHFLRAMLTNKAEEERRDFRATIGGSRHAPSLIRGGSFSSQSQSHSHSHSHSQLHRQSYMTDSSRYSAPDQSRHSAPDHTRYSALDKKSFDSKIEFLENTIDELKAQLAMARSSELGAIPPAV